MSLMSLLVFSSQLHLHISFNYSKIQRSIAKKTFILVHNSLLTKLTNLVIPNLSLPRSLRRSYHRMSGLITNLDRCYHKPI